MKFIPNPNLKIEQRLLREKLFVSKISIVLNLCTDAGKLIKYLHDHKYLKPLYLDFTYFLFIYTRICIVDYTNP